MPGLAFPIPEAALRKPTERTTAFPFLAHREGASSPKFESRAGSPRPGIMEDIVPKLRALIVDDEAPARLRLRELLVRASPVVLAGECANGTEAVAAVRDLRPELLFLDVQ